MARSGRARLQLTQGHQGRLHGPALTAVLRQGCHQTRCPASRLLEHAPQLVGFQHQLGDFDGVIF